MNDAMVEQIARMCHETNRAWCEINGDSSQAAWEHAPTWQHESCINGVKFRLDNPNSTVAMQHENWLAVKQKDGWVYGETKDVEKKTHPCMLPYEQLPYNQRVKDSLFAAVVDAISKHEKEHL